MSVLRRIVVLSLAVLTMLAGGAVASDPNQSERALRASSLTGIVTDWMDTGTVPVALQSRSGRIVKADAGDGVSKAQLTTVFQLLPRTYKYAGVARHGRSLEVTAFYPTPDKNTLLLGVYRGALDTPRALPTVLVPTIGAATHLDTRTRIAQGVGLRQGGVPTVVVQQAAEPETCNCTTAKLAKVLVVAACEGVVAVGTGAAAAGGPGPAAAVAVGGTLVCGGIDSGLDGLVDDYCETCRGTKDVELTPATAHGYQSTNRPTTAWSGRYYFPNPDGVTMDLSVDAPMNGDTSRKAAVARTATWNAGRVICCTSYDYYAQVRLTVEFATGYGYATGQILVHRYGT